MTKFRQLGCLSNKNFTKTFQAFINPEDIAQLNAKSEHKLEPKFNDPDVERVRR